MGLKKEYKIFINEMIKHGDENKAVLKAYPHLKGDVKKIRTYCGRLMKNVEISTAINKKATKIAELATNKAIEELKDEIKVELLTVTKKREILRQIAEGELKVGGNEPDHIAIMKAIDLDNKMAGHNATEKIDVTTKGNSVNTSQLPTDLKKQILAQLRNHK